MASAGEEALKSVSRDSAASSTLKQDEPCETSSRPKKGRKPPLFTQKDEIKLLKELVKFQEKFGKVNQWKEFHKMSEFQHEFSETQITQKMRRLNNYYKARQPPPPDADHRKTRIFKLSKFLWGTAPPEQQPAAATAHRRRGRKRVSASTADDDESRQPKRAAAVALPNPEDFPRLSEFFADGKLPEILRNNWVLMGTEAAMQFEQRWRNLCVKEVSLWQEKLVLKKKLCLMLSEIIRRDVLAVQSSSPSVFNLQKYLT
ncbi:hypothetical protein C2S53_014742 [Perilla frutescens var. hirtella]|uniref:Glabrous enhancer-binding protein-like DBD domain-containing protein n=1 Tax=Perilla frutescens var. hirtella TaxID=608512 RepID=A0AAD4JBC9_PERFH|nr:hypothetical protein C2S53_014742 [Perilla frutescens var. hirtella]